MLICTRPLCCAPRRPRPQKCIGLQASSEPEIFKAIRWARRRRPAEPANREGPAAYQGVLERGPAGRALAPSGCRGAQPSQSSPGPCTCQPVSLPHRECMRSRARARALFQPLPTARARFGSVLENVMVKPDTRQVHYASAALTENTRARCARGRGFRGARGAAAGGLTAAAAVALEPAAARPTLLSLDPQPWPCPSPLFAPPPATPSITSTTRASPA
jgi:hypothetical protein